MISLPVQERFRLFIRPHLALFGKQINFPDKIEDSRITVWADVDTFKKGEDAFVWGQNKHGQHVYSVYFDGIFICHIDDHQSKTITLKNFWEGFLKAYALPDTDPGKIWLNKDIYADKAKEQKEKKDKQKQEILKVIKDKEVKTETQAIAKEIALDVAKSQHAAS